MWHCHDRDHSLQNTHQYLQCANLLFKYTLVIIIILLQVNPSPWYPVSHEQLYPPSVLVHVALKAQLLVSSKHSFMSKIVQVHVLIKASFSACTWYVPGKLICSALSTLYKNFPIWLILDVLFRSAILLLPEPSSEKDLSPLTIPACALKKMESTKLKTAAAAAAAATTANM